MKELFIFILCLSVCVCSNAEIIMPKIFSDYMVLQREMPVKIWGKADANASVKVDFAGQSKEATACENGNWSLLLEPMQANASNQNMTIFENGKASKEITDILVGEVWVAGGQSNMVRSMKTAKQLDKIGARENNPLLRMFSQEIALMKGFSPLSDAEDLTPNFDTPEGSKWDVASAKTTGDFGATAFFFAEKLIQELNVPVGIVQSPVGGSNMISWLAKEDLKGIASFEEGQKALDEAIANYTPPASKKAENKSKKDKANKTAKAAKDKKDKTAGVGYYRKMPSFLYNTKIAPIAGYTARGFIWYQGEADAGGIDFTAMFERVIKSWRNYWGDYFELDDGKLEKETMPFYFVQLPAYEAKDKDWAQTRWAQYLATKKLEDVEFIVTLDTGEENNIHPTDKDIVGARLGSLALAETYDLKKFDDYDFPIIDEVKYKGSQVEVEFDTETDLVLKGALRGFEVLVGKKWVEPALVELKDDEIILKSKDDSEILGVRYLWKNWTKPEVCLYNKLDLPAMSFVNYK